MIEEVETKEPVCGLWKLLVRVRSLSQTTYEEDPSRLRNTPIATTCVLGFAVSVVMWLLLKPPATSIRATTPPMLVVLWCGYAVFDDFQIGVYANYGDLAINTDSNKLAGSVRNPTGWGGGITADIGPIRITSRVSLVPQLGDQTAQSLLLAVTWRQHPQWQQECHFTLVSGAGAPTQVGSFYSSLRRKLRGLQPEDSFTKVAHQLQTEAQVSRNCSFKPSSESKLPTPLLWARPTACSQYPGCMAG